MRRVAARVSVCLMVACAWTVVARATDGDAFNMDLDARVFSGMPHDVALDDPTAYVGLDTGLAIYDVTRADLPEELGHIYLPSPALDLAVAGNLVYVANDESGLTIIDVSNAASPFVVGRLPTVGTRGVAVQGRYAYLAEASVASSAVYGLRVVDVLDPSQPLSVGFLPLPNGALAVSLSGAVASVGIGSELGLPDHGLVTVNVSAPSAPTQLGFLPTGKAVNDVQVLGSVAYLACGFSSTGSLIIANISAPATPSLLAEQPLADVALGLSVVGGVAYVAARALGLLSFDVTDPSAPRAIDALPTGRGTRGVAARGDLSFLAESSSSGQGSFTVVATPPPPEKLRQVGSVPYAEATDVAAGRDTSYLLRRDALHVFDTSTPTAPAWLGSWSPAGADLSALAVDGLLAAVAEGSRVRLVDLSDPASPTQLGVALLPVGAAIQPLLDAGRLYVINGRGFDIFDVSNPTSPAILGSYATTSWASALAVQGTLAYMAAGTDLEVIDVATPSVPGLVGLLPLPDQVYAVDARDDVVVLGGLDHYLLTVDVSVPASPQLMGLLPGGLGFGVRLRLARQVLVAAAEDGLVVAGIANLSSPTLDGFYDTSGTARAVAEGDLSIHLATTAAQHWMLSLIAGPCSVFADITPKEPSLCEGEPLTLDGGASTASACEGGTLLYQWYEEGAPIPGADSSSYEIPASHPAGRFDFALEVGCAAEPSCRDTDSTSVTIEPETWPVIQWNSLKLAKKPTDRTLSWSIESGSGETNVHRTPIVTQLQDLYDWPATLIGFTAGTSFPDDYEPPTGVTAFYQVFGRLSCSGASAQPP